MVKFSTSNSKFSAMALQQLLFKWQFSKLSFLRYLQKSKKMAKPLGDIDAIDKSKYCSLQIKSEGRVVVAGQNTGSGN